MSDKAEKSERSENPENSDSKSQSKTDSTTRGDKTSRKSTKEGSDKSKKTTKETSKKTSKRDDKTKDQGRSRNRDSKVEIRALSPRNEVDVTDVSSNKDKNYYVVNSLNTYNKLRNTGLVVVKYSTKWCGPCKSFAPIFKEIATRFPETLFLEVDTEAVEHEDCDVRTVPAFKIILNGSVRRSFTGASEAQKESIERYVTRYSSDNYSISITFDGDNKRNFTEEDIQRVVEYMKSNPV